MALELSLMFNFNGEILKRDISNGFAKPLERMEKIVKYCQMPKNSSVFSKPFDETV